jgi:hypothetical protein
VGGGGGQGRLELGTNETIAKKCRTLSLLLCRNLIYVISKHFMQVCNIMYRTRNNIYCYIRLYFSNMKSLPP